MVGLRGVGKTVLLDQMRSDPERTCIHTIRIEAPENRSLPAILAPQLDPQEAEFAIVKPAHEKGADFIPEAVYEIVERTRGYPYFLQEWGEHSWDIAKSSPITLENVRAASTEAIAALDESFFRVRFDRLTPKEKQYLRAMAELGPGPHRSGDFATLLVKPTNSLGLRALAGKFDYQRYDLESEPRRYCIHCSVIRRIHEADHVRN